MFEVVKNVLLCFAVVLNYSQLCISEPLAPPPALMLYSPGEPEYTDILVKRVLDNLTLVCELRGDSTPRVYVWNYIGNGTNERPYTVEPPSGATNSSQLQRSGLQVSDSGHYMCSAPPFSITKYVLVQPRGSKQCALGAFACEARCVLASYVCDGRRDCLRAEDEAPALCSHAPCSRGDKLNCSSGRCISEAACCRPNDALCRQPDCCDEHPRFSRLHAGFVEMEYPPLFEDRRAPDDYGFIQSTIYTVTACALIFMIAVVLLVSAICKMHMKRAALRSYTDAERAAAHHYSLHYAQSARYPPCYEASRLLERAREAPASPAPPASPAHDPDDAQGTGAISPSEECPEVATSQPEGSANVGLGLARLSAIFSSRYRQVPTQCCDVEMTEVRSASLQGSPSRGRGGGGGAPLADYRSPTYCDLAHVPLAGGEDAARELNAMASSRPGTARLTLQLGRFQLSLPRLGRPRPGTPDVIEPTDRLGRLDLLRLGDTYTLNGRTIRLLGADFENYPCPPPYAEAVRCKRYGPPPQYLSREVLRPSQAPDIDEDAAANVEMPPRYDELAVQESNIVASESETAMPIESDNFNTMPECLDANANPSQNLASLLDSLPAIDSDPNANDPPLCNN